MNDKSIAMEIISDYKKANKRMFILNIILILALITSIGYIFYLLNDIGSVESTIDVQDVETIDNSHIKIGDDEWVKSQ